MVPAVPVRNWQATLAQVREKVEFPVERPAGAIAGKGGIVVRLQPRIGDGLAGVREYMSRYPYGCLEQKISKAVALKDKALWQERVRELPAYLDDEGLLKYFPRMQTGSDVLTAYVLAITHESAFEIPASTRDQMSAGLTGFVEGRVRRGSALATADLAIRKVAAVEALSRYGKAKAALLGSVAVEPTLWPTSAVIDWIGVLKRVGDIPERGKKLTSAQQILRARLNLQGTSMGFSTERADGLWWLMVTPDVNAVRTLLAVVDLDAWKEDAPRIAKGTLGRMKQGHWDTTTANAWGVLAFEKFSANFEKEEVSGKTTSALGPKTATTGWGLWETPQGGTVRFDWPEGKQNLAIRHEGKGAPWATIQGLAAVPLKKPFSSGYRIKKTVTPRGEKGEDLLEPRRRGEGPPRGRGPVRHDLGRPERPHPCGLGHPHGGSRAGRGQERGPRARGLHRARLRGLPVLLQLRPEGHLEDGLHASPQQRGDLPASAHAGRGALRAGDVRRDPQRFAVGESVKNREEVRKVSEV